MKVAYERVSTSGQSTLRQDVMMQDQKKILCQYFKYLLTFLSFLLFVENLIDTRNGFRYNICSISKERGVLCQTIFFHCQNKNSS